MKAFRKRDLWDGHPDREVGVTLASPFEPMLRGREMPSAFIEEFMLPLDASHDVLLEGVMEQVWSVRWIKPLLRLLARWDVLFPEDATDVPTTMHIFIGRDRDGRLCHNWNRTFLLPTRTRRINAHLVWEHRRGWVAEWMGPGGCLEMAWHVTFVPPNIIRIDARLEAIRLGKVRIPLPRLLQLDAITVDTADLDHEGVLSCDLLLRSPLFGRLFGYQGAFRVRRIPTRQRKDALSNAVEDRIVRPTRHSSWLRAAALYNTAWGLANILWPKRALKLLGAPSSEPSALWQAVGMFVAVYAPAYWWAARDPLNRAHLVALGLLGKIIGPAGFLWAVAAGRLPPRFGLTILSNDVVWWPAFSAILRDAVAEAGGWHKFLVGKESP